MLFISLLKTHLNLFIDMCNWYNFYHFTEHFEENFLQECTITVQVLVYLEI